MPAACLCRSTLLFSSVASRYPWRSGRYGGTATDLFVEGATCQFCDRVGLISLPTGLLEAGFHIAQIRPFEQRQAARQFYADFYEILNTGRGG